MSKNEFVCDCNVIHENLVNEVVGSMPDEYTFNNLADLFKLIGDTTRCHIFQPFFAVLFIFMHIVYVIFSHF